MRLEAFAAYAINCLYAGRCSLHAADLIFGDDEGRAGDQHDDDSIFKRLSAPQAHAAAAQWTHERAKQHVKQIGITANALLSISGKVRAQGASASASSSSSSSSSSDLGVQVQVELFPLSGKIFVSGFELFDKL